MPGFVSDGHRMRVSNPLPINGLATGPRLDYHRLALVQRKPLLNPR